MWKTLSELLCAYYLTTCDVYAKNPSDKSYIKDNTVTSDAHLQYPQ